MTAFSDLFTAWNEYNTIAHAIADVFIGPQDATHSGADATWLRSWEPTVDPQPGINLDIETGNSWEPSSTEEVFIPLDIFLAPMTTWPAFFAHRQEALNSLMVAEIGG